MIKDRPILFSAPMVRAILDGTKTQTRRAMKTQPHHDRHFVDDGLVLHMRKKDTTTSIHSPLIAAHCPYGQPGDRMWVRETGWERPERTPKMMREGADTWAPYYYDADGLSKYDRADFKAWGFKRRPSIHMPRWASRILIEVTDVRVERLQDISDADAISEGIDHVDMLGSTPLWRMYGREPWNTVCPVVSYRTLWESINGPGSWAANPWVWCITFRRITQ